MNELLHEYEINAFKLKPETQDLFIKIAKEIYA
jgi:hypothetical protein